MREAAITAPLDEVRRLANLAFEEARNIDPAWDDDQASAVEDFALRILSVIAAGSENGSTQAGAS